MSQSEYVITGNQFGNNSAIHQGNKTVNHHYNLQLPSRQPTPTAVQTIPYPRNEQLVDRPDLVDKLNLLLPQGSRTYNSAALCGLGGSGKTQIALNFAYQRYDRTKCPVFWVHADNEATFTRDYKKIAHEFRIDESLKGEDLLTAVCHRIAALPDWVLILDNADDLKLFGVDQAPEETKSLFQYIPRASTGTVLWTSRDAHIAGTLVGSARCIEVASMKYDEAKMLLKITASLEAKREEADILALLETLQWFPLAIMQAGAYMRRTSTSAKEYSALLAQSKQRWDILKANVFDRHRRSDVPNNILETWAISIARIREESELAYNVLHVIAYVANQNIPHEVIITILKHRDSNTLQLENLDAEAIKVITRLREFSFLGMHQMEDGSKSYEMHKLVQEATRYGLSEWRPSVLDKGVSNEGERYFSTIALQVIHDLFPEPGPEAWPQCEKYLAHALQTGEWADLNEQQAKTCLLLDEAALFLAYRGRWRERELVDKRVLELRRKNLEENHQLTISSIVSLGDSVYYQGRYIEAEALQVEALNLRRKFLGDKHRDTISSMGKVATIHTVQGRYGQAESLQLQVLALYKETSGDKHPDTISSIGGLAETYYKQGRYNEADVLQTHVLRLRQEIYGEKDISTTSSMERLALTYRQQGRYDEAEALQIQVLHLQQENLGDKHPDTIVTMSSLASTYHGQGRYSEAEAIEVFVLDHNRDTLGDKHPNTLVFMHNLALTWKAQGRHSDAHALMEDCARYKSSVLGPDHPYTIRSFRILEEWKSNHDAPGSNVADEQQQPRTPNQNEQKEEGSKHKYSKNSGWRKMIRFFK
ncbi:P-loop containing nucleoside triphosphate hydrolase protein [Trichoderma chlorosporum]